MEECRVSDDIGSLTPVIVHPDDLLWTISFEDCKRAEKVICDQVCEYVRDDRGDYPGSYAILPLLLSLH